MKDTSQLQPVFSVDDPLLLQTDLTACTLLLQVGSQHFGYAVLDEFRCFLALKYYSFQLDAQNKSALDAIEQFLDADKLLYTAFKQTVIGIDSAIQTLVPAPLYQAELKRDYLQYFNYNLHGQAILADKLPQLESVNIYAIDKNVLGYLKKEFATENVKNTHTALLQCLYNEYMHEDRQFMCIMVYPHNFSATVFSGRQLLYHQHIDYHSGLDVAYHALNILNQLELLPDETTVYLGGAVTEQSLVFEELYKYIMYVEWLQRPYGFHYSERFNAYPAHHFFTLLALAACE